ncbi:MAG: biopolymer transporter ExbD, partial [Acidobacteriota bacterium]
MSMAAGGSNDYKSDINITPLVDVVLVLLIIFMVITPLLQMGYDVKVPPKAPPTNIADIPPDQLVVSLMPNNKIFLNKQELTAQQLATQLADNLKNRRDKTVFFSADDSVAYGDVATLMDVVRNAGANNLGIVLETVPV